jgi:ATP-dependent DNA helicase DinG
MEDTLSIALRDLMKPSSLKSHVPHFEERPSQYQMAEGVLDALLHSHISLIEAGTGIGKSLAYLLPALLFAQATGEHIVISTNTIILQEQLLYKDIPRILALLNAPLIVAVAKGMNNYVCLEKLSRITSQPSLHRDRVPEEEQLSTWCQTTETGSKSDVPFGIHQHSWDAIAADIDTCSTCRCQHTSSCFLIKARAALREAHLILTNHHFLCADLARRRETGVHDDMCLLPTPTRLIIDEAHHLEDIATLSCSSRSSKAECLQALATLSAHIETLSSHKKNNLSTCSFHRERTHIATVTLFSLVNEWLQQVPPPAQHDGDSVCKRRLTEALTHHCLFDDIKTRAIPELQGAVHDLCSAWHDLTGSLREHQERSGRTVCAEGDLACSRLEKTVAALQSFFRTPCEASEVRWVEQHLSTGQTTLVRAPHDLSTIFRDHLFGPASTVVLCSATLAAGSSFDFVKSRLGISDEKLTVHSSIFPSPFDYNANALLVIPSDLPPPDTAAYAHALPALCSSLICASNGGTLILFTSYMAMQTTFDAIRSQLQMPHLMLIKQGDLSRKMTLEAFQNTQNAVLFATSSFWEGVDIPGAALRSVIITKLPFDVPTDPLTEARSDAISSKGASPFMTYALPRACVRFKQAFGRLLRRNDDRGAVTCLDTRILTKAYGRFFLKSLPSCPILKGTMEQIIQPLTEFFQTPMPPD